jgi:adenylylsulfate kinase-like enzyme
MEYDVFARIDRGERLMCIGSVTAPTDNLARFYAKHVYDEEDWVELCVVARQHICWERLPKGLYEKEEVGV